MKHEFVVFDLAGDFETLSTAKFELHRGGLRIEHHPPGHPEVALEAPQVSGRDPEGAEPGRPKGRLDLRGVHVRSLERLVLDAELGQAPVGRWGLDTHLTRARIELEVLEFKLNLK